MCTLSFFYFFIESYLQSSSFALMRFIHFGRSIGSKCSLSSDWRCFSNTVALCRVAPPTATTKAILKFANHVNILGPLARASSFDITTNQSIRAWTTLAIIDFGILFWFCLIVFLSIATTLLSLLRSHKLHRSHGFGTTLYNPISDTLNTGQSLSAIIHYSCF